MKIDRKYPRARVGQSAPPREIIAAYLRDLAARGMGCTTNNATIGGATGLSVEAVKAAKEELVAAKRLVAQWQTWVSIDGVPFRAGPRNDVERLKDALRRKFRLVCDPRTVEHPDRVPNGPPRELLVDDRRLTIGQAWELAAALSGVGV